MRLRTLLLKRLSTWLGLWLLACMLAVYWMGQGDVQREHQAAQTWVGDLARALNAAQPLREADWATVQAELAKRKVAREREETERELLVVGLMLLLMASGSGLVVWLSLRGALNQPLNTLVDQLQRYCAGERPSSNNHETAPYTIEELHQLHTGIEQLMRSVEQEQTHSQDLLRRMLSVQEHERQTIAQDLHDHLGQWLTSISVNAAFLQKRTQGPALDSAQAIFDQCQLMMQWLRSSLRELKPHLLLEVSLRDAALDLLETWARRQGWFVDFAWSEPPEGMDETRSIQVFRVLQEALTNVARHSQAKRVQLLAGPDTPNARWVMLVRNDGLSATPMTQPGLGLTGLQERAKSLGGLAEWTQGPEQFELMLTLPMHKPAQVPHAAA